MPADLSGDILDRFLVEPNLISNKSTRENLLPLVHKMRINTAHVSTRSRQTFSGGAAFRFRLFRVNVQLNLLNAGRKSIIRVTCQIAMEGKINMRRGEGREGCPTSSPTVVQNSNPCLAASVFSDWIAVMVI